MGIFLSYMPEPIHISDAMLEAGCGEFVGFEPGADYGHVWVAAIYRAMEAERLREIRATLESAGKRPVSASACPECGRN